MNTFLAGYVLEAMREAAPESRMISKWEPQSCARAASGSIPSTTSWYGSRVRQAKGAFPNSVTFRKDLAAVGVVPEGSPGSPRYLARIGHNSGELVPGSVLAGFGTRGTRTLRCVGDGGSERPGGRCLLARAPHAAPSRQVASARRHLPE